MIGKPFGFKYEIKDQKFHLLLENNASAQSVDEKIDVVRDNRNIVDNIENQKLSRDDIEKLKLNDDISGNVSFFESPRLSLDYYLLDMC